MYWKENIWTQYDNIIIYRCLICTELRLRGNISLFTHVNVKLCIQSFKNMQMAYQEDLIFVLYPCVECVV